jgi:hypothetical protein
MLKMRNLIRAATVSLFSIVWQLGSTVADPVFNIRSFADGCFSDQRKHLENNGMPDSLIVKYCVCNADAVGRVITTADVEATKGKQYEEWPAELRSRVYQAGLSCKHIVAEKCRRVSPTLLSCTQ